MFHSENVYKKLDGTGITIDNRVVAKLAGKRLSFRSFFYARQIFDLSSYYQDATDTDIAEFAQLDKVSVRNVDQLKQISDTWVRRRLWLVQQSKILETVDISDLIAAVAQFNLTINRAVDANGKELIVIPEDKRELKNLLRFLDDDYYTSPVSKNNYRTNSKVRL
nr:Kiwa anti-phage protein KwaB-like domain-containing protein [Xanthomonas vasicola]